MLELVQGLKTKYHLKVFVVSNEAREVNAYRIRKFQLNSFVDAFVCSCFVSLRKPDAAIFRLAVELAQVPVRQIVYIENTALFVQVAESFGIRTILHTDFLTTLQKLGKLGLEYKD